MSSSDDKSSAAAPGSGAAPQPLGAQTGVQTGAQSCDPATDQLAVSATPSARAHLARMLVQEGAHAVRLGANESGCNGYMYELSYATSAADTDSDHQFDVGDGLTVLVSQKDLPLVQGTQIDYVTEGLNSALKFSNPNADTHCGCGESFSIAS